METIQLDHILTFQVAIAWAGEANSDPPRMGWWRTALCDEFGGEDLLRRLTPKTWQWAALEACRAAAKKVDGAARKSADDADNVVSLYRLGFEVDERLDERFLELKQGRVHPTEALPDLKELFSGWSKEGFESWLKQWGSADYTATATGRRLKPEMPENLSAAASQLVAALLPLTDRYTLPHFRVR